ncbi:MAG: YfcE family phosphodiesterase [Lactobacillaceae bacterium]|jgi:putative phosphoesterase|nr:YfcE family phosphodiesterase [Lactobacillaceae bacterium]
MDYLFVSDAHGDREILVKIRDAYRGKVRAMFYNGDSELERSDELFNDYLPVIGNMDFDTMFPDDRDYRDDDVTIFQTHGHLYQTELNLNRLRQTATQKGVNVVTSGHTHKLGAEMIDDQLYLNPGSISLPKGRYAHLGGTYAILSVTPAGYTVQFYTRDLKPVEGLRATFEH